MSSKASPNLQKIYEDIMYLEEAIEDITDRIKFSTSEEEQEKLKVELEDFEKALDNCLLDADEITSSLEMDKGIIISDEDYGDAFDYAEEVPYFN